MNTSGLQNHKEPLMQTNLTRTLLIHTSGYQNPERNQTRPMDVDSNLPSENLNHKVGAPVSSSEDSGVSFRLEGSRALFGFGGWGLGFRGLFKGFGCAHLLGRFDETRIHSHYKCRSVQELPDKQWFRSPGGTYICVA